MNDEMKPSEVVFLFAGYLTTLPRAMVVGAVHDASPMAEAACNFIDYWRFGPPREGWPTLNRPLSGSQTGLSWVRRR